MPTYPTVSRTFRGPQSTAMSPSYTPKDVNTAALKVIKMQQDQADEEAKRIANEAYRDKSLDLRKQSFDIYKKSVEQRDAEQKAMAPVREAQLTKSRLDISKAQDEEKRRVAAVKRLRVADALESDGVGYERELQFVAQKIPELANATQEQRKAYAVRLRNEAAALTSPEKALTMYQQTSEAEKKRAAEVADAKAKAEAAQAKMTPLQERATVKAALAPVSSHLRLTPIREKGKIVSGTVVTPESMAALVEAMKNGSPLDEAADVAGIEIKSSPKLVEAEAALNAAKEAAGSWISKEDEKNIKAAQTAYDDAAKQEAEARNSFVWDEASGRIVDVRTQKPKAVTAIPPEQTPSVSPAVQAIVAAKTAMKQEQAAAQAEAARPPTTDDKYNYLAEMLKSGVNAETGAPLDEATKTRIKAAMSIYKKRMMPQQ